MKVFTKNEISNEMSVKEANLSTINYPKSDNNAKYQVSVLDVQSNAFDKSQEHLLKAAKQLRTDCFYAEFGVLFEGGIDSDNFDEACYHIVLTFQDEVIATSRLLVTERANLIGRFYTDNEFYLRSLISNYPYPILEVGRTCIHPTHRGLNVMMLLWRAIAHVAQDLEVNAFMGCCSIPIGAGNVNAWLKTLQSPKLRIKPKHRLPMSLLSDEINTPPLLNMYLRMGASIANEACFDPDFHCADVFVWLPFEQLHRRYHGFFK